MFQFFKYPHTDLNQGNLDWIISKIKDLEHKMNGEAAESTEITPCAIHAPFTSSSASGDCTIITCGDFVALIDFGPPDSGAALLTYLASKNINHIDACIVSHYHADHIGDYQTVLSDNSIDISNCVFYLPPPLDGSRIIQGSYTYDYKAAETAFTAYVRNTLNRPIVYPVNNTITKFSDDLSCRWLNTDPNAWIDNGFYSILVDGSDYTNFNNFCMVCEFIHHNVSTLLTADIQFYAMRLLANYINNPTVYKVPHHGNNIAAYGGYLDRLTPNIVFCEGLAFKTQYFNSAESQYYVHKNIPVYTTEQAQTAIIIVSDGYTAMVSSGTNGYINYLATNNWVRSGEGTINTDIFNANGYARWYQVGNLVYVMVNVQTSVALPDQTNVYQNIPLSTGLPNAFMIQRTQVISNNRSTNIDALNSYARIDESGNLAISTRGALPQQYTTFNFGFVYIAK